MYPLLSRRENATKLGRYARYDPDGKLSCERIKQRIASRLGQLPKYPILKNRERRPPPGLQQDTTGCLAHPRPDRPLPLNPSRRRGVPLPLEGLSLSRIQSSLGGDGPYSAQLVQGSQHRDAPPPLRRGALEDGLGVAAAVHVPNRRKRRVCVPRALGMVERVLGVWDLSWRKGGAGGWGEAL